MMEQTVKTILVLMSLSTAAMWFVAGAVLKPEKGTENYEFMAVSGVLIFGGFIMIFFVSFLRLIWNGPS